MTKHTVVSDPMKPGVTVRRLVRDAVVDKRLMPRMVKDLKYVMDVTDDDTFADAELYLWSELEVIAAGINWSEHETAP